MNSKLIYTDEAKSVITSYLSDVGKYLSKTELSEEEVEGSIEELREHIDSYCELKANGSVISTDIVKSSINKLGSAKMIAETLQNELDFSQSIRASDSVSSTPASDQTNETTSAGSNNAITEYYEIKASHIVNFYEIIMWIGTALAFFTFFSNIYAMEYHFHRFAAVYLIEVIFLQFISTMDRFKYNLYLRANIGQNFHINIIPILVTIFVLFNYRFNYSEMNISVSLAIVSFVWFLNFTNLGGKVYFENLIEKYR